MHSVPDARGIGPARGRRLRHRAAAASWAPLAHAALAAGGFAVCHNTADTSVWHSRRSPWASASRRS
ncbi:hypothetical protein AWV80_34205 [Cupriavidus sp. UYMU48A]|nr:hypothetical protein AWV80_34205 [Cupriavidus sp. UYMU48A]